MDFTYLIGVSVTVILALGTAFFKWLSFRFDAVENQAKQIEVSTRTELQENRLIQQKRHEDNQHRFEKISVAIAHMGNGLNKHASH